MVRFAISLMACPFLKGKEEELMRVRRVAEKGLGGEESREITGRDVRYERRIKKIERRKK